jgi:FtsP/CotA-like multicopper oxidase with cupredoxin domain
MQPVDEMLIGPGSRREVLVRGGTPGSYKLEALPFDQFPMVSTSPSTLEPFVSGDEAVS